MPHKVLVCDDESHILYAVSFKFSRAGFGVLQASNGLEAMQLLESDTPDLIITDLQMPHRDGFELCRFLRERPETARIPIIMLTAKALEVSEEEVKATYNVDSLFMKPFSPRKLLSRAETILGSQSVRTSALT